MLEEHIGYRFRKAELLQEALTHPSLAREINNQRLEFLGDSVLAAVVARLIYDMFPREAEGELARRHAALVRGETLARVAREAGLGEALLMAESESLAGGRLNPTNLEDACEALIGALFLDGGYAAAEAFILPRWRPIARESKIPPKDAKTALQEWAQARGLPVPAYAVTAMEGPSHAPIFTVEARLPGHDPATATAPTKKQAEQAAAGELLSVLEKK